MAGNSPPPGWYSDGQGRQRWWDGNAWFESVESGDDEHAQGTRVQEAGSESHEPTIRMSPGAQRSQGERLLARLLMKGPHALLVIGGVVTVVGITALLVVDPTCFNNEECGALSDTFWALFGQGIILLSAGLLLAAVGFIWYRRHRRTTVEPDSAEPVSVQSGLPGRTSWYRRWWGIALIAIPILAAVGVALGLGLSGDDDSGSTLSQDTSTQEPFQAEELTAEEEAAQAAEEEAEAQRQAEAEAKAEAEKRDPKTYKSISHRKWAQVAKDPDSFVGKKYVLYGRVWQLDSATGTGSLLADTDAIPRAAYDYDISTWATAGRPKTFRKVVEDDLVKMYVEVEGSYSYDTQVGGNTTVPSVLVNIIKITGSAG